MTNDEINPQAETNPEFAAPRAPVGAPVPDEVFLADSEAPVAIESEPNAVAAAPSLVATRLPAPGFLESIAWMIGFYAVQFAVAILAAVAAFFDFLLRGGFNPTGAGPGESIPGELINKLMVLERDNLLTIVGLAQAATIVFALLAIRFRHSPQGVRRLGWQPPGPVHWLLVAVLTPALCLLCSALQNVMFQWMPWTETSMNQMFDFLGQSSLPALILVVGFEPALAEELLFRGLIGRGLVGRWGLVRGMLLTSVLFGVMHLNPAQAIGVIPLGLAMHFVYFTTRSFWAPLTLHLLNNSLSMLLLKLEPGTQVEKLMESDSELPIPLLIASLAMVVGIAVLLWQTRVQYALRDGSVWNPGYASAETPPPEADAMAMRQRARPLIVAFSALGTLAFTAAFLFYATG